MGNDLENHSALCAALQRAVPDIVFPGETITRGKVRGLFVNRDYGNDKSWKSGAGLTWLFGHLSGNPEPVLALGFEKEAAAVRRKEWHELQIEEIRYIRLPADIDKLREYVRSLSNADVSKLEVESTRIRIAEFQKALRSDLWHGPLSSIRRNMNGILTDMQNEAYEEAAEKLRLNLERYVSVKNAVDRIKKRYPPRREPFKDLLGIEVLLKKLEVSTRNVLEYIESDHARVAILLNEVDETIRKVEATVNNLAPKVSEEK